jgi:hypothetical protein
VGSSVFALTALLAVTAAAGCSSSDGAGDRDVFLVYRAHPIQGTATELQCHNDGQCAFFTRGMQSHVEAFVSGATLDRVRDGLESAGFADLESTVAGAGGPGAYEILFEGHRVAASGARPIPELDAARAELDALVEQVRSGQFKHAPSPAMR